MEQLLGNFSIVTNFLVSAEMMNKINKLIIKDQQNQEKEKQKKLKELSKKMKSNKRLTIIEI
jgi:hypothetical protein